MKKNMVICFVVLMLLALTACGEKEVTKNSVGNTQIDQASDEMKIELRSCKFAKEVRATDNECATSTYPAIDGKVYVDTVIVIINNSKDLTKKDFSGYVTYDERRYDLQYCIESYTLVSVENGDIPAAGKGSGGIVHLFASVPEEATESEKLTVHYTVDGKEYTSDVSSLDEEREPLVVKKELQKGDKESLYESTIEFEFVECKYTKYLQASDYANTEQYSGTKPFIDCVIKLTNKTTIGALTDIFGYSKINNEIIRADVRMETENNTKLEYLSQTGVEPGQTEYIHISVPVDETIDKEQFILRFNLGENCYYCKAE